MYLFSQAPNAKTKQYRQQCNFICRQMKQQSFFFFIPLNSEINTAHKHTQKQGIVMAVKPKINGQHRFLILSKLQTRFTMAGPRG